MKANSPGMEDHHLTCPCCQNSQNPLYCQVCLGEGIALHNQLLRNLQNCVDGIILQSRALLNGTTGIGASRNRIDHGVDAWRELKADIAAREARCMELRRNIAQRETSISTVRMRLSQSCSAKRRDRLERLKSSSSPELCLQNSVLRARFQHQDTVSRIVHARQVLVREAASVFGLKRRRTGDWEIAGLVLPPPKTLRLYPSVSINAALSHTVHLLTLITAYLSIALPFVPTPAPPLEKVHVGRLLMKANLPFVSTTKWREKHSLWMSSTASISNQVKSKEQSSLSMLSSQPAVSNIVAKSANKHKQFLISFALLSFSVAYLAWSQDVPGIGIFEVKQNDKEPDDSDDEAPRSKGDSFQNPLGTDVVLIPATSILQLIHAITLTPTLGQRSHGPGGSQTLGHLGFGLDVAKVIQTILRAEEAEWNIGTNEAVGEEVLSEGWDLLDVGAP